MSEWNIHDGAGIYGSLVHYGCVVAFVGSAFLLFLYCWWNGKLNMDEGPKFQMMQDENQNLPRACLNNDSALDSKFFFSRLRFRFEGNIKPILPSNRNLNLKQNNLEARMLALLKHALRSSHE